MMDSRERCITPHGLGRIDDWRDTDPMARVELDKPPAGTRSKMVLLDKISEVFRISDHAILRILSILRAGCFSNFQFRDSASDAWNNLSHSTPPDEMTFYLDLKTGKVEFNRKLWDSAKRYAWTRSWIDRWGRDETRFSGKPAFIQEFEKRMRGVAGPEGVSASMFLDLEARRVLKLYLSAYPHQGVVYEKKFI